MSAIADLLPCPFCGGGDIRVVDSDDPTRPVTKFWMIVCETKDCTVHPFTGAGNREAAADRWNRRATGEQP